MYADPAGIVHLTGFTERLDPFDVVRVDIIIAAVVVVVVVVVVAGRLYQGLSVTASVTVIGCVQQSRSRFSLR